MRMTMPWFCLVASAGMPLAWGGSGIDAYREGKYLQAAELLSGNTQTKDPIADYYMAKMRLYGYGELKNNQLAIRYFQSAAQKGYLPAQQIMASYALLVDKNPEQALVWFKKAADNNDVKAQMYCAAAYTFGVGTKKNEDAAKKYLIGAAKNGNSLAQYALADSFINSRHGENKKLGLLWLNKAVAQNNPAAQLKLGELYTSGNGVPKDLAKAKEAIIAAVAQGYVPALYGMGQFYQKQSDFPQAESWYLKAANAEYVPAKLALSALYAQPKGALFDEKKAFDWMLKAAESGSSDAAMNIATFYKTGKGVPVNENLAQTWKLKAELLAKGNPREAQTNAALWLSLGKQKTLAASGYELHGIFSDWKNQDALKQNNYNQPPQMDTLTRDELYKPKFVLTKPNEIPLSEYYNALASLLSDASVAKIDFPLYPIDKETVLKPEHLQASLGTSAIPKVKLKNADNETDLSWANDPKLASRLESRANLGDSDAQFALGLFYLNGLGVAKNIQNAITYFTMAMQQQELRGQYMLALIYLQGLGGVQPDYQQAINLLTDAAYKGNDHAQYVLGLLYKQGYKNAAGEMVIKPDNNQAVDMFSLAAASDFGLAQYHLAEILVREKEANLALDAQRKRNELIKKLYQGAFASGVEQAALPLAYFYAMESDPAKRTQAFEVAKKGSATNNPGAALLLGLMFDRGIATSPSHSEAMYWYQQATGNPVSAFILGTYTSEGDGVSKDLEKGKNLLQEAANAGFPYAYLNLGVLKQQSGQAFLPELNKALELGNSNAGLLLADYYLSVANNPQQMQQARAIYTQFAEKGNREGQLKLGFMYDKGLGGPVDAVSALKWYTAAAEQGQPQAQYLLGQLYQMGRTGTVPDYELAKKWYSSAQGTYSPAAVALGFIYDTVDEDYLHAQTAYEVAAGKADPIAALNLGLIFEKGKGRAVDFEKAKALYQQAADKGVSAAMVQLAGLFFNGSLGEKDGSQALEWYKKAAAMGNQDALYQLGLLAETGVLTRLDLPSAVKYYQESAHQGNAKAKLALARMYQFGLGVEKNLQLAQQLYQDLAKLGNGYAQYQLASLYYSGVDGSPMPAKGKELLRQAQDNGYWQAKRMLQRIDAQSQERVSFIEPAVIENAPQMAGKPADLMYLDALSAWNRGDELRSRKILDSIRTQFPHYAPAKRAYEQINQPLTPQPKTHG